MQQTKKIKTALVSVYHKDGLSEILSLLAADGVKFISTGGTRKFIEEQGYSCEAVENLTGYPSIFGGRVKTLHPAIFGGILMRRDFAGDIEQASDHNINEIDLVIVDLYPFSDTVASGASEQDIIEKIDIGGISLIRGAAKNFNDVVIVASKKQYAPLVEMLKNHGSACSTLDERYFFAREAFAVSSEYDSAIFNWFDRDTHSALRIAFDDVKHLRYGENPHQEGRFYGNFNSMFEQVHGKEISYNNLLDIDSAVRLIDEFDKPSFAILKHNNPCGIAERENIFEAYKAALACDPVSAFGGVFIANGEVDETTATEINKIFFEVIIAPSYSPEALKLLESKKNRIILVRKSASKPSTLVRRTVLNGMLEQDADQRTETLDDLTVTTNRKPTDKEISDMLFGAKVCKHCKSNAIVLAKNGSLLAAGVGQTSRVDSLRQAIDKARSFGFDLDGAIMASDAFFPFADCVEIANNAGITATIHPGGSIRDGESVEYCNAHDMAMVVTGLRHFRH